MIGWAALSLVVPLLTGWLVLGAIWPGARIGRRDAWVAAWLAAGLGLGIASASFFVAALVGRPGRRVAVVADVVALAAALGVFALRVRAPRPAEPRAESGPRVAAPAGVLLLRAAVALATLSALAAFVARAWDRRHGEWDAWAVWNLHALFLVRGGDHWRDMFSPALAWFHPDYPLLLPALVARFWSYLGSETPVVPAGLALGFTFGTAALASGAVAALRGEVQGLLAALVLLGTPVFIWHGASQYADLPLAFFALAGFVFLVLGARRPNAGAGLTGAAGAMLGLAAWTKNEGLLVAGAAVAGHVVVRARRDGPAAAARALRTLAVGLAPPALLVLYLKLRLAPPGGYLWPQGFGLPVPRVADLARYVETAGAFGAQLVTFRGFGASAAGVLLAYGVCLGVRLEREDRPGVVAIGLALAVALAGYFAVFVISPYPLTWLLRGSVERLFLQLWPSLLFAYWLTVRSPSPGANPGRDAGPGSAVC